MTLSIVLTMMEMNRLQEKTMEERVSKMEPQFKTMILPALKRQRKSKEQ